MYNKETRKQVESLILGMPQLALTNTYCFDEIRGEDALSLAWRILDQEMLVRLLSSYIPVQAANTFIVTTLNFMYKIETLFSDLIFQFFLSRNKNFRNR